MMGSLDSERSADEKSESEPAAQLKRVMERLEPADWNQKLEGLNESGFSLAEGLDIGFDLGDTFLSNLESHGHNETLRLLCRTYSLAKRGYSLTDWGYDLWNKGWDLLGSSSSANHLSSTGFDWGEVIREGVMSLL